MIFFKIIMILSTLVIIIADIYYTFILIRDCIKEIKNKTCMKKVGL